MYAEGKGYISQKIPFYFHDTQSSRKYQHANILTMNILPFGVLVSTHNPTKKNLKRPMMEAQFPLVFGDQLTVDKQNRVFLGGTQVCALYDRFPFQSKSNRYPLTRSVPIPIVNPQNITRLCKDKWALQKYLTQKGMRMPETARDSFSGFLKKWNDIGIAKPRFGSYGVGISIVEQPPPPTTPSVCGEDETLLQRWIHPPQNWAGMAIRQLVQRNPDRSWTLRTTVLRYSNDDPIVNVTRGAKAIPAKELLPTHTMQDIHSQSIQACSFLSELPQGDWIVEVGIDFVIDTSWSPWLIEINAQPKGKLKALKKMVPEDFHNEYMDIIAQPFRCLRNWCRQ